MTSAGNSLREGREARGFSIKEVSAKTRITRDYIKAMEEDRYDVFPAEVYLLNFVRKYSEYLCLDTDAIVHEVKNSYSSVESPHPGISINILLGVKKKDKGKRAGIIVTLLMALIAAGWIIFLYDRFFDLQNIPKAASASVLEGEIDAVVADGVRIRLRVKDKTWIKIVQDGKLLIEKNLFAGHEREIEAVEELRIRIGNVYGVDLWQGKEKVDIITGNRGAVNEIVFKRKGQYYKWKTLNL